MKQQRAFTLVELSIVLVILGLLIGGVLTGQSLIRAAELRSIATDQARFVTATHTFRDKYFALPGDMTNATSYWGKDNSYCSGQPGAAATPGTCNGDGNGQVAYAAAANQTGELFQYWKQLALAGLIEGQYTGISGPYGIQDTQGGVNAPKAKISGAGWAFTYFGTMGDSADFAGSYGHAYQFGGVVSGVRPYNKILKPEEAYNLDMKIDDGKPATGKLLARYWNNECANGTANTDQSATYRLNDTTNQCAIWFIQQF